MKKLFFLLLVGINCHADEVWPNPYRQAPPAYNPNYAEQMPKQPAPVTIYQGNPTGAQNTGVTIQQGDTTVHCEPDYRGVTVCK